jgi:hypothetical protein
VLEPRGEIELKEGPAADLLVVGRREGSSL